LNWTSRRRRAARNRSAPIASSNEPEISSTVVRTPVTGRAGAGVVLAELLGLGDDWDGDTEVLALDDGELDAEAEAEADVEADADADADVDG
jgi:hypothetical protein